MRFTPGHLRDYLAYRLRERVEIDDFVRFGRGASRETWFVSFTANGEARQLSFRLDFPAGSVIPGPLDQEYFIYRQLSQTDVPVAKALWWEEDPKWTSRPFYVREHVKGEWNVPGFSDPSPEFDELRIAISKEHLSCLAKVHRVDWRSLGFDAYLSVPPSREECAATFIDTIVRQYEEVRSDAVPMVLEAAEAFRAQGPTAPAICLCKGTNGLGEEVFRDNCIVAMSDWEEASIGDPSADFGFLQSFIPEIRRDGVQLWGLEQALDYYHEKAGIRIDPASIRFYGVLRALKAVVFGQKAAAAVHKFPELAEIRHAWNGTEISWFGKKVVGAALGWTDPPPATLYGELNQSLEQVS